MEIDISKGENSKCQIAMSRAEKRDLEAVSNLLRTVKATMNNVDIPEITRYGQVIQYISKIVMEQYSTIIKLKDKRLIEAGLKEEPEDPDVEVE